MFYKQMAPLFLSNYRRIILNDPIEIKKT